MLKKIISLICSTIASITFIGATTPTSANDDDQLWIPYIKGKDNIIYAKTDNLAEHLDIVPQPGTTFLEIDNNTLNDNPSDNFSIWIEPYYLEEYYKKELEDFQAEQTIDGISYSELLKNSSLDYETFMKIVWDTKFYLLDLEAERLQQNGIQVTNVHKQQMDSKCYIYAIVNVDELNSLPLSEEISHMIGLATMKGDAQIDGHINILDVISVNKALLGKESLTELQINAADINKNGIPDSEDSLSIMKHHFPSFLKK